MVAVLFACRSDQERDRLLHTVLDRSKFQVKTAFDEQYDEDIPKFRFRSRQKRIDTRTLNNHSVWREKQIHA